MKTLFALALLCTIAPSLASAEENCAPATRVPGIADHLNPQARRKCDSDADCPGFANSCFAGSCTSDDDNQCNSDADCPGFANSCFAGHCTSQDTNQCDSDADCPGFANSCFAGHCTNP